MAWLFDDIGQDRPAANSFRYREHQVAAVDAVIRELAQANSCYVVSATGTGKTEMICLLIDRLNAQDGCLIISPRIELVDQTASRLRSRGIQCAVERAHMESHEPATVACYDSLLTRRRNGQRYEKFLGKVRLVVVDEVHVNYTEASCRMLAEFREAGAKVVGWTATPRVGKADPLSDWYGQCAFSYLYQDALRDGYLVPYRLYLTVLDTLDLSKIRTVGGDYDLNSETFRRWCRQESTIQPVRSLIEQEHEGKPCVAFVPRIDFADLLNDALHRTGVRSCVVHSRMDANERRYNLSSFESGENNVVINVGCLTMGWDHPATAKLFLCRPTQSSDLYGQQWGRACRPLTGVVDGLRTAEQRREAIARSDKPYMEVYDFCDASRHSKLVTAVDLLYPHIPKEVRESVARKRKPGVAEDLDAIVAAEQAELLRSQKARDTMEMSKRRGIVAHGTFRHFERDAFAEPEYQSVSRGYRVMLWGAYKAKPLHTVPVDYLRWTVENCTPPKKHPGYFPALRAEITRRNKR